MPFTAVTPNQLGQAAATTSPTVLYTVPVSTRTFVKDIDICNTTGAIILARIFLVPNAGVAGPSNAIAYDWPIPAKTTVQWGGAQIIGQGATIQIQASAAGVTFTASGGEAV